MVGRLVLSHLGSLLICGRCMSEVLNKAPMFIPGRRQHSSVARGIHWVQIDSMRRCYTSFMVRQRTMTLVVPKGPSSTTPVMASRQSAGQFSCYSTEACLISPRASLCPAWRARKITCCCECSHVGVLEVLKHQPFNPKTQPGGNS